MQRAPVQNTADGECLSQRCDAPSASALDPAAEVDDIDARIRELKAWLEVQGYRVAFRSTGWTECLVWVARERWTGRGADEADSLADALHQMLPSRVARRAMPDELRWVFEDKREERAEQATPVNRSAKESAVAPDMPAGLGDASEREAPHAQTSSPIFNPPPVVVPTAPTDDHGEDNGAASVLGDSTEQIVEDPVSLTKAQPPFAATEESLAPATELVPSRWSPPLPALPTAKALEALEPLLDRIAAEQAELGLATPTRQQLVITAWICEARAIEASSGHAPAVVSRTADIARKLTALCKLWWPGSVLALQLSATPDTVCRSMGLSCGGAFGPTWDDVVAEAERRLALLTAEEAAQGRDEYGWADGAALAPQPLDPEADMAHVRAAIERVKGPISETPPRVPPTELVDPTESDIETYRVWCQTIRWLRGWVTDFDTWGRLVGRVRWLAQNVRRAGANLAAVLDPAVRPTTSWAMVLGRDPEEKRRRYARLSFRHRVHALNAPNRDDVIALVNEGLKLFDHESLREILRPFGQLLLPLLPEDVAETRAERRRFRKVQEALARNEASPVKVQGAAEPELVATEEPATDPVSDLLSVVRPHTAGRHVAFVTNRADPDLEDLLRGTFQFAEIDWCEGTPRRLETIVERIKSGAFDYVLAATGFQAHRVDGKLYGACKREGIPYVRVNKGRPVACAVALARELGLASDA